MHLSNGENLFASFFNSNRCLQNLPDFIQKIHYHPNRVLAFLDAIVDAREHNVDKFMIAVKKHLKSKIPDRIYAMHTDVLQNTKLDV